MSGDKQIDIITDLLIDFDEMGFAPTTLVPDPEGYAIEWRKKLTNALQGYRKQSEGEWIKTQFVARSGFYWSRPSRRRTTTAPIVPKKRYVKYLKGE